MSEKRAAELNPLVLAFVGDGVQTLYVRTRLVSASPAKSGALHTWRLHAQCADFIFPTLKASILNRAINSTLHALSLKWAQTT